MSSQKAKEKAVAELLDDDDLSESGGSENEPEQTGSALPESSTPSTSSKKKKKKRSRAAQALNSLRGSKDGIPQELVNVVLDKVRAEGGEAASSADAASVRLALEQMKIKDVMQGKSGLMGKNKKDAGDHKFWGTQPVPQLGDAPPVDDGYIEPPKPPEELRQEPYPLPKDFEWATMDIAQPEALREVYELLSSHYVEDDDATFRFQYSAEFLKWAMQPPEYHREWHVGVRVVSNKKLVAFVSAVPMQVRVRNNVLNASEVNFLCVHKKLRHKRLAPVLIKEITRLCNLKGVFQALYTAGALLPTPVSTCRYQHRCLNVRKLVEVQFTYVPSTMTLARMIRLNKVADRPRLLDAGLREMEERDIASVTDLFARYMRRFGMSPMFSQKEVRHHFLSGRGAGAGAKDSWKGPGREGQVVWTYVVENPETHKVTDYFSFYLLPSTVMSNEKHNLLRAGYLYYYATDTAFLPGAEADGRLKRRLEDLINDALVIADKAECDVFNCLTMMDNPLFITDLKFGMGDGMLNFYLYNWRTAPLAGATAVDGMPVGKGIGLVML